MKKFIKTYVVVILILSIFVYLGISYIKLDFNILNWDLITRKEFVGFELGTVLVAAIIGAISSVE